MNPDLFSTPEGIAEIRRSQQARFASSYQIDFIIDLREQKKKFRHLLEQDKASNNKMKAQIGSLMKSKNKKEPYDSVELDNLLAQKEKLDLLIQKNEVTVTTIETILEEQMNTLGNIVDVSVPVSNDEKDNRVERVWTNPDLGLVAAPLHHSEVMWRLGAYEDGSHVAGQRGYFLTGPGLLINMALQQYGIDFLRKKGYRPVGTPLMMTKSSMAKTAQLSDYDDQLYKVNRGKEHEEAYLIATSEQPLTAMFMSGTNSPAFLDTNLFPIRMAGISTCFRKEAGKSGKDMRGLFRLHQFEKVEQFCIVAPEKSQEEHQRMLSIAEEFYQSLGLSYRVVNIVSGALNDAASIKYDIEAYFCNTGDYRELVSCSQCLDYQSRKLNIKYGYNENDKKAPYAAMLNSTLVATERTMCCIMEAFQTETGFTVPPILRPYCYNIEKFDFVRELKK
jgi:seryl-tRNA synthetase